MAFVAALSNMQRFEGLRRWAMLLQCANDDPDGDGVAGWLRAGTLSCLSELNEECLEACVAQARAGAAPALCNELAAGWSALEVTGRQHVAGCLYLVMDAGFAQVTRWRDGAACQVDDEGAPGYAPWFTVPAALPLAQGIFTFAWHLARCQGSAARLLLGMPAGSLQAIAACTLGQVRALARRHPHWLRPRFLGQPGLWRELFAAAASGEPARLERARLRGQTLLAAEVRLAQTAAAAAAVRRPGPRGLARQVFQSSVSF
jgi:hypothetical protein